MLPRPPMSFRAQRGISPFAQRKGAREMLGRGREAKNHGNHGSKPPPFAFTPCHSERSEESPPSRSVRGIGGCPIIPIKVQNAIITP